jgi:dolichyl-phosphate beta-glucosyltransferase
MVPVETLSIVIPAYNEDRDIGATLTALTGYLCPQPWAWEILVVDDGSTDGTCEAVQTFSRGEPRVRLQREPHRGKGGTVRAGLLAARARYRFVCDADLSMPLHELPRFLPPAMDACDIAIGTREGAGAKRVNEPWPRHLAGRAFNTLVRWAMLPGIQDTQCGFKMFTADAVDAIFPHVTVEGWAFDIEVLHIAQQQGLRIRQVPIEWHYGRKSRLRLFADGFAMVRDLMMVRGRARRGEYARR